MELTTLSHPTWVRGLKLPTIRLSQHLLRVAPYVGAWIETFLFLCVHFVVSVAPYVGAWIETPCQRLCLSLTMSHPTWVRGLKHKEDCDSYRNIPSHPTWVRGLKHRSTNQGATEARSHPTWVRGLKPSGNHYHDKSGQSHPTWVRGLKQILL